MRFSLIFAENTKFMDEVRVIEIKKIVFEDNDKDANALRKELKTKGVFLLNLMSAPGSGKTTTLIQTLNRIKDKVRVAVMEADIDSDVDAVKIVKPRASRPYSSIPEACVTSMRR